MTTPISLTDAANAAAGAAALPSAQQSSSTGTTGTGSTALQQLGGNFQDFLNLLMTQLKNQDPTTPMDTNQFTTELVQFTGVQQQVATNSSLTQLIQLQQGSAMLQSANIVGKQADVTAPAIALQNGAGAIRFSAAAGQQVAIAIVDAAGHPLRDATVTAAAGQNSWTWDGRDNSGATVPDGAYRIAVETAGANGAATPLSFDVLGTATGLTSQNGTLTLDLGALAVPLSALHGLTS